MRRSQTPKTTPTAISGAGVHQPSQGAHPSSTANWSTNVTLRSARTRGLMSSSRARPSSSVSQVAGAGPGPWPATAPGLVFPMAFVIGTRAYGLSTVHACRDEKRRPGGRLFSTCVLLARRAAARRAGGGLLVGVGRHVELGELVGEPGVATGADVLE